MKLATLRSEKRDGSLIVVDRALERAVTVPEIARNLQEALNEGHVDNAFCLDTSRLAAPLPRAYQWLDGSAYLGHVELARKARGAEMPPEFNTDPLMYQGCSDVLLGSGDPVVIEKEDAECKTQETGASDG